MCGAEETLQCGLAPQVFPLAFAVNAAYHRREQALQILATVQSAALALHTCHQCWMLSQEELGGAGPMHCLLWVLHAAPRVLSHICTFKRGVASKTVLFVSQPLFASPLWGTQEGRGQGRGDQGARTFWNPLAEVVRPKQKTPPGPKYMGNTTYPPFSGPIRTIAKGSYCGINRFEKPYFVQDYAQILFGNPPQKRKTTFSGEGAGWMDARCKLAGERNDVGKGRGDSFSCPTKGGDSFYCFFDTAPFSLPHRTSRFSSRVPPEVDGGVLVWDADAPLGSNEPNRVGAE